MTTEEFNRILGAVDTYRAKRGLGGRTRKRFVRPELRVQRLFYWLGLDGQFKLTGKIQDDNTFIETLDYRLESAVIGRAYAEGLNHE